ncbi:MAG: M20/M25/M40 family metallo-hydrolase, partial [Phycisphaerae bacterium]|nr:M20/M25/M40 family metallo-hydrolase [Phycisphaerae bacterium]
VRVAEHPTMGGEDFSYYAQHVPACFFFLGLRPEHAASYPGLHQPDFDFNDDALETGVEMMVALALGG